LLTGPQKIQHYNTNNERVFLAQQAADAKTAMQRTVVDIQAAAKEAANVSWWTQQYPWYAVGAVAVLGFVATISLRPPADQRPQPAPAAGSHAAARPSWMAALFEMGQSVVMSIVTDAINPSGQPSAEAQADTNVA